MVEDREVEELFSGCSPDVRALGLQARALVHGVVPDAVEEFDPTAKLLAFTFQPGTYKGLIVGIVPQSSYVNLMFSKGVELLEVDGTGLLEGTGKRARHIKVRDAARLRDPALRDLLVEAAGRTPR